MIDLLVTTSICLAALGSALIAGVFFAFSAFIMTAFARAPAHVGITAMQSINRTILGSLFMPVFFGTAMLSAILVVVALSPWGASYRLGISAGAVLYLVGVFLCTIVFNVPLNQSLDAADASATASEAEWSRYVRIWTRWNHVRTVASLLASTLFVWALW